MNLQKIISALRGTQPDIDTSCKTIQSVYINWLKFANAGMLHQGNIWCMDYALRNIESNSPIIEIGSFCGLSTNVITHLKEKNNLNNSLISCDKWMFEGAEQGGFLGDSKTVTHEEYHAYVKESFIRNVRMFSRYDLPYTIELISDDFFDAWEAENTRTDIFEREINLGGPVSFCYIDGNHTYEFAKRDFDNCDKFLEEGGFVLFDDSSDGSGWEVCQVVQEVMASNRYELIAKNPNYFFRKK
ncbi:Methyltransferase [Candidatus Electrothrix laxa]